MSSTAKNRPDSLGKHAPISAYQMLAFVATAACLFALVDGLLPQFQLFLLGGHLVTNVFAKATLVMALVLGVVLRPRINIAGVPVGMCTITIGYLILEIAYLSAVCGTSLGSIWQSFNDSYSYYLIVFGCVVFRDRIPEKVLIRCTICSLVICAAIGIAQHVTEQPLLYTESVEGKFAVQSWAFHEKTRAFSLFTSGLDFGTFCALCGALGVALSREHRMQGILFAALSALACYTTLTRVAYLLFISACTCSALLTFGKSPKRGLWLPLVYLLFGTVTMVFGLQSFGTEPSNDLQNASSAVERLIQWTYYTDVLTNSSFDHQLLGLGIVQGTDDTVAVIDNVPLALALHIGILGTVIFWALRQITGCLKSVRTQTMA